MKIIMLLSNGFAPDPRVANEALTLQAAGHQVTIFAWDRTGQLPKVEDYQGKGITVVRSQVLTTYSRGPLQILRFAAFWKECREFLKANEADLIHCHDLDTLLPGVQAGRSRKLPVIFDAHESYPDMVAHVFPAPVVTFVRLLEKYLVPRTAAVITVGEGLSRRFQALQARRVVIVGNYKKHGLAEPVTVAPPLPLKVIYVGGLNRDRLLGPLIAAVAGDLRFELLVVGDGPERQNLTALAAGSPNIRFAGFLPQEQARELINQNHLVYYGVDPAFPNNQYSAPNSLFMALAAGRPLVTTAVGEIAQIVEQVDCGTVLPDLGKARIVQGLERYFSAELWQRQSENAFQASKNIYNWDRAGQNLIGLYRDLE